MTDRTVAGDASRGLPRPRAAGGAGGVRPPALIPLLHVTDLYHPAQDPDDQIDLATVAALSEFDLRGVVLDVTRKFLEGAPAGWDVPRDPGYVPVIQLGHLLGRAIPVAMGPTEALRHAQDGAENRPRAEQAGIALLLEVLSVSAEPVVISVVGSARVVAAAFNREPALVRAKTKCVLLNAGSTGGPKREWNVSLDPAAYVALWRSGLPLHWYPCGTDSGAFDPVHERGTFWKASHAVLFQGLPAPLRAWFAHGLAGNQRGDLIRALAESGTGAVWEHVLAGERNLWSTASLVMAAGRELGRTWEGWRFLPCTAPAPDVSWPWRLDPIHATVDDDGGVDWRVAETSTNTLLFGRQPGAGYAEAMAEALNALLRDMPV
jgi:pyrimidine-specific ribonucleoside hydrolase